VYNGWFSRGPPHLAVLHGLRSERLQPGRSRPSTLASPGSRASVANVRGHCLRLGQCVPPR
jgi:hypothetical protein